MVEPEACAGDHHCCGALCNNRMRDAQGQDAVVALLACAFGECGEGARDGLVDQGLVARHSAADRVRNGLAHVAQDIGATHRAGEDRLPMADRAVTYRLGRHELHGLRSQWSSAGSIEGYLGRRPNRRRFNMRRAMTANRASVTRATGCLCHNSAGLTLPSNTSWKSSTM